MFAHDPASLARANVWNLTTLAGDFDISFRPTGTDGYGDLVASAVVVDLGGHEVAVAALADVIRSKRAAGRAKDAATRPSRMDGTRSSSGPRGEWAPGPIRVALLGLRGGFESSFGGQPVLRQFHHRCRGRDHPSDGSDGRLLRRG